MFFLTKFTLSTLDVLDLEKCKTKIDIFLKSYNVKFVLRSFSYADLKKLCSSKKECFRYNTLQHHAFQSLFDNPVHVPIGA